MCSAALVLYHIDLCVFGEVIIRESNTNRQRETEEELFGHDKHCNGFSETVGVWSE